MALIVDVSCMEWVSRPWRPTGQRARAQLAVELATLTAAWRTRVCIVDAGLAPRMVREEGVEVWEAGLPGTPRLIGRLARMAGPGEVLVVATEQETVREAHLAGALVVSPETLRAALDRVCRAAHESGAPPASPLARAQGGVLGLERARRWFAAARAAA